MEFYLKAEPNFDGSLSVKEFWRMRCPDGKGLMMGIVDEDIKKENAKEYDPWHANVEANAETLYPAAKAEYLNEIGKVLEDKQ